MFCLRLTRCVVYCIRWLVVYSCGFGTCDYDFCFIVLIYIALFSFVLGLLVLFDSGAVVFCLFYLFC